MLVGLGLLVAGVIVQGSNTVVGVALGVGGFVLMLLGAWLALSTRSRQPAPKQPKARAPKESLKTRLEERWQRRQDEGR